MNIFFGKNTVMGRSKSQTYSFYSTSEFERSIRVTPIEFISSLGGLFGLCLGFSIISFIEIFYWGTVRICRSLGKASGRRKMDE